MSRGSDTTGQRLWSDPALAELVEQETAAVLWSLDGERVIGASVGTAGLAPALRAAGGENLRGRLRRVAAALSSGSGVRLERVTLPQGYGITRLLLECHRVATQNGEFLLTILRGPLPRLPRLIETSAAPQPPASAADTGRVAARKGGGTGIQPNPLRRLLEVADGRATVRFIWESDAQGRLTRVSGELAALVGDDAGRVEGRAWQALIEAGIVEDYGGTVVSALARQATWSGKEVLWRIGGEALARLPVELAGIPVHDGERRFRGYRGFGLARVSRLAEAARESGAAAPEPSLQEGPSLPVHGAAREAHHHHGDMSRPGLSENERQAFRDIAKALGGNRLAAVEAEGRDAAPARPAPPENSPVPGGARRLRLVTGSAESAETDQPPRGNAPPENVHAPLLDDVPAVAPAPMHPFATLREEASRADARPAGEDASPIEAQDDLAEWPPRLDDLALDDLARDDSALDDFPPEDATPEKSEPAGDEHVTPALPAASAFHGVGADVTDSVALIANRLPVGMLVSRDGEVLFVNRALLDLLGYEDVAAFRRAGGLRSLFMSAPGGGEAPLALRTAHGAPLSVDARMATIPWRGDLAGHDRPATLMSFRRAIEPRTEAHLRALERELRHQEARVRALDTILDTATDGVVTLDGLGRLLSMNRSAEALFGCEETDVVGGSFWHMLSPGSRSVATAYFEGMRAGGLASVLNDGVAVRARAPAGEPGAPGEIPLTMIMGRLAPDPGDDTPGIGRLPAGRAQRFFAILRDVSNASAGAPAQAGGTLQARREPGDQAQFLARVSHEIRTPLNAIIGFTEIMLEERLGPIGTERYREYLRDIHASGGQIISLVNDLLDLARIEEGRLELAPADVSLNDVVSGCVGLMTPQAERQRVVLRTSLPPGLASVSVDERALQQIVLNLLSNAVKFTDAGGQVIVSTAQGEGGGATLRIRDTGIGMTRAQVTAALTPFAQLTTTHLGRPDGAGLGLPLTRALVEASGGRFAITSAPMEGTLVEIALPPAAASGRVQEKVRPSSQ